MTQILVDKAVIEQALEALVRSNHGFKENPDKWPCTIEDNEEAITALREALAEQAEQEPVGYVDEALRIKWLIDYDAVSKLTGHKLYAAPVRTKDLTDDEIHKCDRATVTRQDFARAVIAADREKNRG